MVLYKIQGMFYYDIYTCFTKLKDTGDELGLCKNNFLCDSGLPLIQLLTNAGDHTQTVLKSMSDLLSNQLSGKRNPKSEGDQRMHMIFYLIRNGD